MIVACQVRRLVPVVAVLAVVAGLPNGVSTAAGRRFADRVVVRPDQDPTPPATDTSEALPPTLTPSSTPTPVAATATHTPAPLPAYLPVALRHHPPLPYKPVLRPIVNPEEDGDYIVEWGESLLAARYELQEDEDPGFGSPQTLYDGPEFRYGYGMTGHAFGTYTYRVRGVNDTGAGAWSDVVTTRVWPPKVFASVADADVSEKFSSTTTGQDISMWAGYHTGGCFDITSTVGVVRSVVRFDLSAIPPGMPFHRAVLNLTTIAGCWSADIDGQWRDVTAFRSDKPWDEGTVNWKNRPKEAEAVGTGRVHAADDIIGPLTIDITDVARRWVDGAAPNHGLVLRALETSSKRAFLVAAFGTREWKAPGERPFVTIEYAAAAAADTVPSGDGSSSGVVAEDGGGAMDGSCRVDGGIVRCGAAEITVRDVGERR